jgi:hypothetical protein
MAIIRPACVYGTWMFKAASSAVDVDGGKAIARR